MSLFEIHAEQPTWTPPPVPKRVVEASQPKPGEPDPSRHDAKQSKPVHQPRRTFADTLELGALENRGNRPIEAWPGRHGDGLCEPCDAAAKPVESTDRADVPNPADMPRLGEILSPRQRDEHERVVRVYREVRVPRAGSALDLFA